MSDAETLPELPQEVKYGHLAFDVFALDNWDYSAPIADDQAQWERLVHEYLALSPSGRLPYFETSVEIENHRRPQPSREHVARVLEPHQTVRERLLSRFLHYQPLWLRTCYEAELEAAYRQMAEGVDGDGVIVPKGGELNDAALYDFGANWARILVRIPQLCTSQDDMPSLAAANEPQGDASQEAEMSEDERAELALRGMLYVADEEAIREQRVKIMWLDTHGKCLWWNKIDTLCLFEFTGFCARGWTLRELLEYARPWGQKGAELVGF